MILKCCWNEEVGEWYDSISIGCDEVMCSGCDKKHFTDEMDDEIGYEHRCRGNDNGF